MDKPKGGMIIRDIFTIEELTEICAGLAKQGLTFVARKCTEGWWIELTGGY